MSIMMAYEHNDFVFHEAQEEMASGKALEYAAHADVFPGTCKGTGILL